MRTENELREQLAACTRIFAMQGMIGLFGHVSVYQPETKRVLITPGEVAARISRRTTAGSPGIGHPRPRHRPHRRPAAGIGRARSDR